MIDTNDTNDINDIHLTKNGRVKTYRLDRSNDNALAAKIMLPVAGIIKPHEVIKLLPVAKSDDVMLYDNMLLYNLQELIDAYKSEGIKHTEKTKQAIALSNLKGLCVNKTRDYDSDIAYVEETITTFLKDINLEKMRNYFLKYDNPNTKFSYKLNSAITDYYKELFRNPDGSIDQDFKNDTIEVVKKHYQKDWRKTLDPFLSKQCNLFTVNTATSTGGLLSTHSVLLYYDQKTNTNYLINGTTISESFREDNQWLDVLETQGANLKIVTLMYNNMHTGCIASTILTYYLLNNGIEIEDIPENLDIELEQLIMKYLFTALSPMHIDNNLGNEYNEDGAMQLARIQDDNGGLENMKVVIENEVRANIGTMSDDDLIGELKNKLDKYLNDLKEEIKVKKLGRSLLEAEQNNTVVTQEEFASNNFTQNVPAVPARMPTGADQDTQSIRGAKNNPPTNPTIPTIYTNTNTPFGATISLDPTVPFETPTIPPKVNTGAEGNFADIRAQISNFLVGRDENVQEDKRVPFRKENKLKISEGMRGKLEGLSVDIIQRQKKQADDNSSVTSGSSVPTSPSASPPVSKKPRHVNPEQNKTQKTIHDELQKKFASQLQEQALDCASGSASLDTTSSGATASSVDIGASVPVLPSTTASVANVDASVITSPSTTASVASGGASVTESLDATPSVPISSIASPSTTASVANVDASVITSSGATASSVVSGSIASPSTTASSVDIGASVITSSGATPSSVASGSIASPSTTASVANVDASVITSPSTTSSTVASGSIASPSTTASVANVDASVITSSSTTPSVPISSIASPSTTASVAIGSIASSSTTSSTVASGSIASSGATPSVAISSSVPVLPSTTASTVASGASGSKSASARGFGILSTAQPKSVDNRTACPVKGKISNFKTFKTMMQKNSKNNHCKDARKASYYV